MRALVKTEQGKNKVELKDIKEPVPGVKQVKIKVEYAGICGKDIHIYEYDGYPYTTPVVLGHEFSGTIIEVGSDVSSFKVGDRVVAETNASVCFSCSLCKAGRFCLCNEREALGQKYDGVFAEYFVIGEETLHMIPENVDMETAALAEPLSCVVHAINERSNVKAGDTAVVTGPGAIGLLAVQVLKSLGAKVIVCGTDIDSGRLQKAGELGADIAVNIQKEDVTAIVNKETKGEGADVVVECSGAGSAVNIGIGLLKKCGIFTQIGLFSDEIKVDANSICFKEITYHGCLSKTNYSWRKTLVLLENKTVDTKTLISNVFDLKDWEKAFDCAKNKKGVKIVFKI